MDIITGTFTGETLSLDGKHFRDCSLFGCTLLYRGGLVTFERTLLTACNYEFGGAASQTIALLEVVGMLGETFSANVLAGSLVN